jgi:hypothetical protein
MHITALKNQYCHFSSAFSLRLVVFFVFFFFLFHCSPVFFLLAWLRLSFSRFSNQRAATLQQAQGQKGGDKLTAALEKEMRIEADEFKPEFNVPYALYGVCARVRASARVTSMVARWVCFGSRSPPSAAHLHPCVLPFVTLQ